MSESVNVEVTDEMRDAAVRLARLWKEDGKGKLSPSKAIKKIVNAKARGCPILDCCLDCPKRLECPVVDPNDARE